MVFLPPVSYIFRTTDGSELVLVDDGLAQTVPRYTLIRRSDLFTAEGYITVYTDSTAEFFERNTRKEWPLARYGHYRDVVRKYHSSVKEKFEGIYLKALSYTVSCRRDNGDLFDAVVFKKDSGHGHGQSSAMNRNDHM